jgi:NAD+ kinase
LKVAIYSRVLETDQQPDIQVLFDELKREKVTPVVYKPFLQELKDHISHSLPILKLFLLTLILQMK